MKFTEPVKRKGLMIVFDGAGDRPIEDLNGKTPYEAAETPNLDELSEMGINGMMDPIKPGQPAGSDTSHLSLLGNDPYEVYKGRGYLEALGIGLDPGEDSVAFRCNYGSYTDGKIVDRRSGRINEGTEELAKAVQEEVSLPVDFTFKDSTEHRAVLVLKEGSVDVKDGDPHEPGVEPHRIEATDEEGEKTAEILRSFVKQSHKVLDKHVVNEKRRKEGKYPANYILVRGVGEEPSTIDFQEEFGVKGSAIVPTALVRGTLRSMGFNIINVEGATGGYDTDLISKAEAVIEEFQNGSEFIFLHFKAPDLAGHDGDFQKKIDMLEKADKMIKKLINELDLSNYSIALTSDHATPCEVMNHSGDTVPLVISGGGVRSDDVEKFGERPSAKGDLGRLNGKDVILSMMDLMGRTKKFGA